jgi:parallel beta-helix repeat protein
LWADTDNNDFDIENNLFTHNAGPGIIYEISYNALVENNTFTDNAWGEGPTNPGFPTGAINLSESGGDSRVAARYSTIEITGNAFTDNWSGVVLWENANRFLQLAGQH